MSRRLAVWSVLLILFVAFIVASVTSAQGVDLELSTPLERNGVSYGANVVQDGDSDTRIAMIPIGGTVLDGDSPADGSGTGGDDIVRMLDAIADDEDTWDGVILELDTPGGSVLASEEVTDALRRLDKETDIEVLAWMRGTAASAGYYMAASADRIVAAESTFTGSIGVILEYYVVDELADEVGVEAVTIKSGKLKDIGSPFRKVTPEERELFQQIIDEAYDSFVDVVASGRDMPESTVRELADGRIYTGQQAKENGLVDEIGLRRTAYAAIAELVDDKADEDDADEIDVVRFSREYDFFESLSASAQPSLDTLATARAVGAILGGGGTLSAPSVRSTGSGFAKLEYRAQLG